MLHRCILSTSMHWQVSACSWEYACHLPWRNIHNSRSDILAGAAHMKETQLGLKSNEHHSSLLVISTLSYRIP